MKEMANLLWTYGSDDCWPDVPETPEYRDALNVEWEYSKKIEAIVPADVMKIYRDAISNATLHECELQYTKGFYDGLAVMQMMLYKMKKQDIIDSEIGRLLDGLFYRYDHGPSEKFFGEILERIKKLVDQRQAQIMCVYQLGETLHESNSTSLNA